MADYTYRRKMTRQLVYQIFGPDGDPVSKADWMTYEEGCLLLKQYPEGCYVSVADGIELWEG